MPAPTPHAAIGIVKDPKSQTIGQGGTAKFTITVTNTGDVTLSNVTVTDPLSPDCNKSLGTLAVGQSKHYGCTKTNVTAAFENVATATGKPPTTATVKATDHAQINVQAFVPPQHPKIAIVKSPKSQTLTTKTTTVTSASGSKQDDRDLRDGALHDQGHEHRRCGAAQREGHRPRLTRMRQEPRDARTERLEDL